MANISCENNNNHSWGPFGDLCPLNDFKWELSADGQRCECVQATNDLIKMGNKQTIFTDEQLDAYQVSFACLPAAC